jgi:hypothetical protein
MALHLNLYHEIQTQSLQRKRDPLRLGMMVILVVAAGFIAFYFYRLQQSSEIDARAVKLQGDWQSLAPQETKAAEKEKELLVNIKLRDTLVQRIEDRCLWGPVLDMVFQSVPPEVQIKSFDASKEVLADKTRHVHFTVAGIAGGQEPRRSAEEFRVAFQRRLSDHFKIVTDNGFKALDDREEKATINGQSVSTAAFVVSYEASMDTPPAAPTTPAKRVKN